MLDVQRCTCPDDADKPYTCMKHEVRVCEECLICQDPSGYCKHRTACPIWYFEKHHEERDPIAENPPGEDP